ncbi:MAG TPA: hypothetical protein VE861_06685 [Gemmatimonadaceae bacterium]|nr:hypothetical protein [Gemmatimonadaceae bacterium]
MITPGPMRALMAAAVFCATTAVAQSATDADHVAEQRIDAIVRDFDRRGLPTDLLRAKVAEGTAKGATPARIADAVTLLAARVDSVARLLAPSVTPQELHAGAEALSVGVSAPSLRDIRAAAGRNSAEPYFLFVVRLMRRGVTQERAVKAARSLIVRRVPSNTLLAFADDLARDVANGMSPDAALNDRMTRLVGGVRATSGVGAASDASTPTGLTNAGGKRP